MWYIGPQAITVCPRAVSQRHHLDGEVRSDGNDDTHLRPETEGESRHSGTDVWFLVTNYQTDRPEDELDRRARDLATIHRPDRDTLHWSMRWGVLPWPVLRASGLRVLRPQVVVPAGGLGTRATLHTRQLPARAPV